MLTLVSPSEARGALSRDAFCREHFFISAPSFAFLRHSPTILG